MRAGVFGSRYSLFPYFIMSAQLSMNLQDNAFPISCRFQSTSLIIDLCQSCRLQFCREVCLLRRFQVSYRFHFQQIGPRQLSYILFCLEQLHILQVVQHHYRQCQHTHAHRHQLSYVPWLFPSFRHLLSYPIPLSGYLPLWSASLLQWSV